MKLYKRIFIIVGLLILSLFGVYALSTKQVEKNTSQEIVKKSFDIRPAPDFEVSDLKNETHRLASYKGKVFFLHFWATWCPSCVTEIPVLDDLYAEYKGKGFEILTLSVDEDVSDVQIMVKEKDIDYPVAMATQAIREAYGGIYAIPTTFIINQNQEIIEIVRGAQSYAYFKEKIESLLDD